MTSPPAPTPPPRSSSSPLFLTPDPFRDKYLPVQSCLYCGTDPVNRVDLTEWNDKNTEEYVNKLMGKIEERKNIINEKIAKMERKL